MRSQLAGPGSNKYKPKTDIGAQAPAGTKDEGFRRTAAAAGPGSVKGFQATQDTGKQAPAGSSDEGFRRTAAATGPGSVKEYHATQDIGKQAPAGSSDEGYRRTAAATGPGSVKEYHATQDIGKQAPAGSSDEGYRRTAAAAGPTSSVKEYHATQEIGKHAPAAGPYVDESLAAARSVAETHSPVVSSPSPTASSPAATSTPTPTPAAPTPAAAPAATPAPAPVPAAAPEPTPAPAPVVEAPASNETTTTSSSALDDAFTAILKRLESVTGRLETHGISSPAGGSASAAVPAAGESAEIGPSVLEYDELINTHIKPLVALTGKLGNDQLKQQVELLDKAVNEQRKLLVIASQSKKPDVGTLSELLKPTSDLVTKVIELRDKNRGNALWNHLSAFSEGVPALGWVAVSPTPGPYIHEYKGNAEFYSNKLLREFKGKDQDQVDWSNHWSGFLADLQAYVKKFHTTELAWNPRGGDAKSAASGAASAPPAAPAGGPPPPPAGLPPPPAVTPGKPAADPSALFAALNKGDAITSGLKHVTKEQKTKFREDKTSVVPGDVQPKKAAAAPKAAPKKGPAHLELTGNKWTVENYDNNKDLVIDGAEPKHVVYIYKLDGCVVKINQKVNAISLDSCKKTAVVFHHAIASVEVVNSSGIDVQCLGSVPSYTIDKCSGVNLILSADGLNTEITSAKSDAMNVSIPGPDGDHIEMPIPEQFKTTIKNGKLHTTTLEHV